MMKKFTRIFGSAALVLGSAMAFNGVAVAETMQHDMATMEMAHGAQQYPLNGTVVSVDAANRQVTLSHDAVQELNWPAMTMPFSVADSSLLSGLQPGQHIMAMFTTKEGESPTIVSLHTM